MIFTKKINPQDDIRINLITSFKTFILKILPITPQIHFLLNILATFHQPQNYKYINRCF